MTDFTEHAATIRHPCGVERAVGEGVHVCNDGPGHFVVGRPHACRCGFEWPAHGQSPMPAEDLRERYGQALMAAWGKHVMVCEHAQVIEFGRLADAVLAVRDEEMERLRVERDEARSARERMENDLADALDERDEARRGVEQAEAERDQLAGDAQRLGERLNRVTAGATQLRAERDTAEIASAEALREVEAAGARACEACRNECDLLEQDLTEAIKRAEQAEERLDGQAWDDLTAHRDALIDEVKTLQRNLEEFGEAQKAWLQWRRERDALRAENEYRIRRDDHLVAERDALTAAVDDTLWRMRQLRSWAYRDLTGDELDNVLSVITNVWDCLDPDRTRAAALDAPTESTEEATDA